MQLNNQPFKRLTIYMVAGYSKLTEWGNLPLSQMENFLYSLKPSIIHMDIYECSGVTEDDTEFPNECICISLIE